MQINLAHYFRSRLPIKRNTTPMEQSADVRESIAPTNNGIAYSNSRNAIQRKVKIGAANDKYEQEADHIANQVVNGLPIDAISNLKQSNSALTQKKCDKCSDDKDEIQRKPKGNMTKVNTSKITTPSLGAGAPLSTSMRQYFEPRFGQDFSHVRLHNDPQSFTAAEAINAKAFTMGRHVAFAQGQYNEGQQGKRLLAHELTHVVQQTRQQSQTDSTIQRKEKADESEIKVIPDPGSGKLRVVRVDTTGKIIAGLAEITPPKGETLDPKKVIADVSRAASSNSQYNVTVPKDYQAATNVAQKVSVKKSSETIEFDADKLVADPSKERAMRQATAYIRSQIPELAFLYEWPNIPSEARIKEVINSKGFLRWKENELFKIQKQRVARENAYYQQEIYKQQGIRLAPEEAREVWERYNGTKSTTAWETEQKNKGGLPNAMRNEQGQIYGYKTYEFDEKSLDGGVGSVKEVIRDRQGKVIHSKETTVLTPATEVIQDLVRNSPIVGTIIRSAEVGGLSLDVRDFGRMLTEGEQLDRAISVVPFGLGDLARGGMEASSGVSLSGRDLDEYLQGNPRMLLKNEVTGRWILIGTAAVGALIGAGQSKLNAQVPTKVPSIEPPSPSAPALASQKTLPQKPIPSAAKSPKIVFVQKEKLQKKLARTTIPDNDNAQPALLDKPHAANDNSSPNPARAKSSASDSSPEAAISGNLHHDKPKLDKDVLLDKTIIPDNDNALPSFLDNPDVANDTAPPKQALANAAGSDIHHESPVSGSLHHGNADVDADVIPIRASDKKTNTVVPDTSVPHTTPDPVGRVKVGEVDAPRSKTSAAKPKVGKEKSDVLSKKQIKAQDLLDEVNHLSKKRARSIARRDDIVKKARQIEDRVMERIHASRQDTLKIDAAIRINEKSIVQLHKQGNAQTKINKALRLRKKLRDANIALAREREHLGKEIITARDAAKVADQKYIDAVTKAARLKPAYKEVAKIGHDQVFGRPAANLDVDHIVSRRTIIDFPGFEKLSWEQQVQMFSLRENLVLVNASANRSRGDLPWRHWPEKQWRKFTDDPAVIADMVKREAALEKILQARINDLLKGK